jgi:TonB family protein
LAPAKARPATQSLSNSNADAAAPSSPQAGPQIAAATNPPDSAVTASMAPLPATPSAAPTVRSGTFVEASDPSELSEDDQLKASIAATPAAERPADPSSVTTTTSQAHANQLLLDAVDRTFAPGLDDRMMAAMPDFWKLYYRSLSAKTTDRPADITILRQSTVDQKAHLLTAFEPASNEFAQTAGVAGMALYRTVISADGEPTEIAVARPIGFGLDESAVASIRKAKFSPAIKDGKPVPVMIDLVVQFRIFSNRTAAQGALDTVEKEKVPEPTLPGPYSVSRPN